PNGNPSRVMRHVDGIYTQRFNRRHQRDGTLFRGVTRPCWLMWDEDLGAAVGYIHLKEMYAHFLISDSGFKLNSRGTTID
ncbi:MAG: transposase, partial [Gammaproteobacteria bacterium]